MARYPWLAYVRATAEASMIGGVADWFAVTALFRHPLGIPIPHTAIIAARKEQIGRSLGNFVSRHFLSAAMCSARGCRRCTWPSISRSGSRAGEQPHARAHTATALASGARMLADDDVQELIDRVLVERIRNTEVAPMLGQMLSLITAGDRHQELLDEAIVLLARAVDQNQELIRERIEAESPWWVPGDGRRPHPPEDRDGARQHARGCARRPEHPLRRRFDEALAEFVRKLERESRGACAGRAHQARDAGAEAVRRFSASIWEDPKAALFRYADAPNAFAPSAIERGLVSLGEAVSRDEALLARIDALIAEVAGHLVDRYQGEVAELIAQTVTSWDPEETSDRVELAIGKDLQFIRITARSWAGWRGSRSTCCRGSSGGRRAWQ